MRALFFSLVISAGLAGLGGDQAWAAAASGAAVNDAARQSDSLTLVRDGCGRGRHFSKWRGVCVWNGSEAPAGYAPVYPRPYYYAPAPYYYYGPVYRPRYYYYGW